MSTGRFSFLPPTDANLKDIFGEVNLASSCIKNDEEISNIMSVLKSEEVTLENDLEEMRNKISVNEKSLLCLLAENKRRGEDCNILRSQYKQLKKSVDKIKSERNALLDDPLTKHDYEKLNNVKSKFVLYERTTGAIFDYTSKEKVQGFIQNDKKGYLKTFSLENNSKIEESLWNEVQKAGTLSCSVHPEK